MPLLHWLTRERDIHAAAHTPYRLLEELHSESTGDSEAGNLVIQGDNLHALKALLPYYGGKVKCIFIDPPYNTRSAFEHYDDNLEHTQWLALMYPRLELLQQMLSRDGSIWVTIDDNEGHYLKVLMDEVFGRKNFLAAIPWQSRYSRSNDAIFSLSHNQILVYARDPSHWKTVRNRLPRTAEQAKQYKNPDNDPRGPWRAIPWDAPNVRENLSYPIKTPKGGTKLPPPGRHWARTEAQWAEIVASGLAYFGKNGEGAPSFKQYLEESSAIVPNTWWPHEDAGHTDEAQKEIAALFGTTAGFATPKPERLLHRVLHIATNPGEIVLDSFLGSGTTAAVAHKMGRRYIGIEMGDHALSHCVPRLRKVIEGEQGGVSQAVGWKSGGGFRFYKLGVPVFDENGHVSPGIRFAPLAAHLWFLSTGIPYKGLAKSPLLGTHEGTAYYLLYNGILGDKSVSGGNVLTGRILASLPKHEGERVIFGEGCRLSAERLQAERITFRQIPYEIKAR